ncbi:hypothetical protein DEO72_LG8g975 [Vigna unguiculata]|uniref:Uncharacterized protein n=1 Tax=Vigna unguiculata TaxID=3917 RepID=A0A4D6MPJ8_VIGUN|nr:hypothetical protein DEO72_LG8g975 [Vigna unguiculata]
MARPKNRQAKSARPPGGSICAARRHIISSPTVSQTSPGEAHLVAGHHTLQCTSQVVFRLAATPVQPIAIPVAYQLLC